MTYELWLGDCLEEMNRIGTESIDLILADLPFGTTGCKWDIIISQDDLWKQYKRIIKKKSPILLFAGEPYQSYLIISNLKMYRYKLVWHKPKPTGFLDAKRQPLNDFEEILVFGKGYTVYNPQGLKEVYIQSGRKNKLSRGVYYGSSVNQNYIQTMGNYPHRIIDFPDVYHNRIHESQKPVPLLEYLIKTYSNEGDLILDNTCGSGSTLEAAERTKRNSIGIEKDPKYFEIAQQRLEKVAVELSGEFTEKKPEEPHPQNSEWLF